MIRLFVLVLFAVAAHARTPAEIKQWFMQMGMECNSDHPITAEEMQMLHKHKVPDSKNVKCLLACVYKKTKWLNSQGLFDVEKTEAMIDQEFGDKTELITNGKKLVEVCKSVNEQTVSDGAIGCERAYLMTTCLIQHSPEFGFDLKHVRL